MSRPDDLNKIERGEQRLKKFPLTAQSGQRKTNNHHNNNNNQQQQQSIIELVPLQTTTKSINGQISLSPLPATQQQQQQQLSDDSFLLEWTNKNSSVILKEEVTILWLLCIYFLKYLTLIYLIGSVL